EAGGVLGANDELVLARLGSQHRAGPADRELVRLDLVGEGAGGAEVEADFRVNAGQDAVREVEAALLVVLRLQAALPVPAAGGTEAADEVGDGVAVLADGQPGQLDARRLVPLPGLRRVEGVVDERGDLPRVVGGQAAGVLL